LGRLIWPWSLCRWLFCRVQVSRMYFQISCTMTVATCWPERASAGCKVSIACAHFVDSCP